MGTENHNKEDQVDENLDEEVIEDDDENLELDDETRRALEDGWNPDYEGDNFVSAKEFNARSSFFKKINSVNRKNAALEKQVKFLMERTKQADEIAYKRALETLKKQKVEALREDDHEAVVEIDEKIDETKRNKKAADEAVGDSTGTDTTEEYQEFLENNSWYTKDAELTSAANTIGEAYATSNPSATLTEIYNHVEKRIKKLYPDHFDSSDDNYEDDRPQRKTARRKQTVESNTNRRTNKGKKSKHTSADMHEDDRVIMRNMIKKGAIKSEAEYIDQLEKSGYFS